jgi:hypothetical protein
MLQADVLAGVVEELYGQVRSHHQRLHRIEQMAALGRLTGGARHTTNFPT